MRLTSNVHLREGDGPPTSPTVTLHDCGLVSIQVLDDLTIHGTPQQLCAVATAFLRNAKRTLGHHPAEDAKAAARVGIAACRGVLEVASRG